MKRNLMAMFLLASTGLFAQYRDGYGRPSVDRYGDRNDDWYDDDRYEGRYRDRGYGGPGYYDVRMAPPPPPAYSYGYRRPPCPAPGYVWVDGYWNWNRNRYAWTNGYWMRPPLAGGYWVAPRYDRGRFFAGLWGGGPRGGGFVVGGRGGRRW